MKPQQKAVFTIPAGAPFARALAAKLLQDCKETPEKLPHTRIFLPTRRAVRVLQSAFLAESCADALLLPRMQPLGDIDEEELSLAFAGQSAAKALMALPPAIAPLQRQLLLARTILARPDFKQGPDHALALARALGRLIDQIHNENLPMDRLTTLAPVEFAEHWQITLKFLEIISEAWPAILKERGQIDAADRRNRLMLTLSRLWRETPPANPVIAAGSTGSIPATAELLATIAAMPRGVVVLPGLDTVMDERSWQTLEEPHPQHGLRELLQRLNVEREHVQIWPTAINHAGSSARRVLASEIMRPATTTGEWILLQNQKSKLQQFKNAFEHLNIYECRTEREESEIIAILLRESLQHKNWTAALITPDRNLARRVAAACRRWGIELDDSAGQSLDQTSMGSFLRLTLQACFSQLAPVPLLALLKHDFCEIFEGLDQLERKALRGSRPAPGFAGLYSRLESPEMAPQAFVLLQRLEPFMMPLITLASADKAAFTDFLDSHIALVEGLASTASPLWSRTGGEEARLFMAGLREEAGLLPDCTAAQYASIMAQLMKNVTIRPAYGAHPRLAILGQLEARLVDADLVILGGLNEGIWPPEPGHDPWMSRPMRRDFGLPGYERDVGLAAHDFVQGFCAQRVALTRSQRSAGAPATPARWLQRLEAVLDATNLSAESIKDNKKLVWARALDAQQNITPCARPEPRPPVAARPRELPATRIETWLQDPYGIYARYVLKLRKLDPLEDPAEARERGILLHEILHRFVETHKDDLPDNAAAILHDIARKEIAKRHEDPAVWSFWWPRFARLSDWFVQHEREWRQDSRPLRTEISGFITMTGQAGPFKVTAKADRIDKTLEGAALIDYKSGGSFTAKGIGNGKFPQLPVEALILAAGGFAELGALTPTHLSYWTLTGGTEPGKITSVTGAAGQAMQAAQQGLELLIAAFDDQSTPYYSLPRPDRAPRFNDYEHLARVKEWTALGENGDESAGEAA